MTEWLLQLLIFQMQHTGMDFANPPAFRTSIENLELEAGEAFTLPITFLPLEVRYIPLSYCSFRHVQTNLEIARGP